LKSFPVPRRKLRLNSKEQIPENAEEAEKIVKILAARGEIIAAAESCTAGLAADLIASVPGASGVFWGSFVTYMADAKTKMLGVSGDLIKKEGAVSRAAALSMAEGALKKSGASWAFSITGLAGPAGDSSTAPADKSAEIPIGTMLIGIIGKGIQPEAKMFRFTGSRNEVRKAAAKAALKEVLEKILTEEDF
jgi:PncC family amidohydrolase